MKSEESIVTRLKEFASNTVDTVLRHPYQFLPGAGLTGVAFANGGPGFACMVASLWYGTCLIWNKWNWGDDRDDNNDDPNNGIDIPPDLLPSGPSHTLLLDTTPETYTELTGKPSPSALPNRRDPTPV